MSSSSAVAGACAKSVAKRSVEATITDTGPTSHGQQAGQGELRSFASASQARKRVLRLIGCANHLSGRCWCALWQVAWRASAVVRCTLPQRAECASAALTRLSAAASQDSSSWCHRCAVFTVPCLRTGLRSHDTHTRHARPLSTCQVASLRARPRRDCISRRSHVVFVRMSSSEHKQGGTAWDVNLAVMGAGPVQFNQPCHARRPSRSGRRGLNIQKSRTFSAAQAAPPSLA